MLWRSVVGKLWLTIILLVTFVLTLLMVLLLQSFERVHVNTAESQLMNHAQMVASMYERYEQEEALYVIQEYAETFDTKLILLIEGEKVLSTENHHSHYLALHTLYNNHVLMDVFSGEQIVRTEGDFPFESNDEQQYAEIMIVGVPVQPGEIEDSAVFLYQSLDAINSATAETRRIVYLSGGIAIIMTTVFAFFLSSRVTAPLRKMREMALEVAKGQFETKIPILTHDEIGQLAMAFNRMGRELNNNIHALNQEKEQLARILGSMADGVITLNKYGKVVLANPPAERFIQSWSFEQGQIRQEEKLPDTIRTLFEQVVTFEKEQTTEIEVQGRSWTILMTPLYDQNVIRGAVAVFRDMTEERRHDKLRKDFIANVSHELRTPISMLQGYSEAIIDDIAQSDEEKKEMAKIIYDESLRIGRLVNELLDLARMEAGHVELHAEHIQLHPFVEKVVRKFQGLAKEQNIALSLDATKLDKEATIDPDRIEQVLTNLLHNAIRHTSEQGHVTLRVRSFDEGTKFDVLDTGSGIPEEDLPFVFERFYKADKARTRSRGGTGLGLAIAKNIVEAHNGHISVHSKLNEGTEFTFFIPNIAMSNE
ncbi:ATP-binding protein [Alkalihalobacillus hemicellulosilyticus]|nr:ATP-binding protein [Halalkalibacter hemicellulosilyticus]